MICQKTNSVRWKSQTTFCTGSLSLTYDCMKSTFWIPQFIKYPPIPTNHPFTWLSFIPSNQGLIEHVKRSAFHAGWLWRECQLNPDYPLITDWGWVKEETRFFPKWCFEYKSLDLVIITCSCKEDGKCNRRKCSLSKQSCLEFCHCQRHCSKWVLNVKVFC